MKPSIILFILFITPVLAYGQLSTSFGNLVYEDTLEFDPIHSWIVIDEPALNVWEAGIPSKAYFNEALSGSKAMMTDSSQNYPTNLNDGFTINLTYDDWWPEAILSFYHKYDTEYQSDGGIVEISYNNGETWVEISEDNDHVQSNYFGLSQDTIGGEYRGYTGISDGWQYVELHWLWVVLTKSTAGDSDKLIRFRFISDENDAPHEGWMIDDIVFRGYSAWGNIEDYRISRVTTYPNPAREELNFLLDDNGADMEVRIYNLVGGHILTKCTSDNNIDISALRQGMYLFELYSEDDYISSGKFVKK